MPRQVQDKLLTCLEERKYLRIGGQQTLKLKAQLIFTTDSDLKELAEKGAFSEQLRYRIDRFIEIPPLKERREDIPCIIEGLRRDEKFADMPVFNEDVISLFQEYEWPGNVRQLMRVLDKIVETNDSSLDNIRTIVEIDHGFSIKPVKIFGEDLKKILAVLEDGEPRKKKEIEQVLGNMKSATLMKRLNELIKDGFINPIGNGPTRTYVATKKIKEMEAW